MDRSLKWRTLALFASVVLCVCTLAPSFFPEKLPTWFPWEKKINLGLDLQGGLHIVYSIDLDRAVDDKASEIKRDLDSRFLDEKIKATVKTLETPVGGVTVLVEDPAKRAQVQAAIDSDYSKDISPRACAPTDGANAICFQVSQAFADSIKKSALANAVTTIRERIDEKGVSEPTVVE